MSKTAKPEDLARVVEFRNRLVAYANYVRENVGRLVPTPDHPQRHIGEESAWLAQEYGRVYGLIRPYGIAQMTQFGGIASTDVVRDTIGGPGHPEYRAIAGMAVQHLDTVIGRMRAEVEDRNGRPLDRDALYRLTSPLYWFGRAAGFVRWLRGTSRGRKAAAISLVMVAIISGVVSGAAQAWFEKVFARP